jgi:hypothetical protein
MEFCHLIFLPYATAALRRSNDIVWDKMSSVSRKIMFESIDVFKTRSTTDRPGTRPKGRK